MTIYNAINTSASALTAQRFRMDVVSSNIANAQTTRATLNENGDYEPYRRKMVSLQSDDRSFHSFLRQAAKKSNSSAGVKVTRVVEDPEPFKNIYNPQHPDADDNGYVQMPNVDPLKEMVDLMGATRSYEQM